MNAWNDFSEARKQEILRALTRRLADDGKLLESGFVSMILAVIPSETTVAQVAALRQAFMFGAQHLFACLCMEADTSDAEFIRQMDLVKRELESFVDDFPTVGNA